MSLNKAIKSGKEHRKPYRGAKAVDKQCRNHGSCPRCYSNRVFISCTIREAGVQRDEY